MACLARNIYEESRNQPIEGQQLVAHVTISRMKDGGYGGNTVCGVVYATRTNNGRTDAEFSWTLMPVAHSEPKAPAAYIQARKIAEAALNGALVIPPHFQSARFYLNPSPKATSRAMVCRFRRLRVSLGALGEHEFFRIATEVEKIGLAKRNFAECNPPALPIPPPSPPAPPKPGKKA